MVDINELPSEILEIIFKFVLINNNYEATHVCKLWLNIFCRIVKLELKTVPSEIIQDLIGGAPAEDDDQAWINLYQLLQAQKKIFRYPSECIRQMHSRRKFLSLDIEGVSMILSLPPNKLLAIDASSNAETECTLEEGCPIEVLVAPTQKAILVKTVQTISFFTLPVLHDFNFRNLDLVSSNSTWTSKINDVLRICVSSRYIAIQSSSRDVAIFNFERTDKSTLTVEHFIDIVAGSAILFMSIWDDGLICTLSGGELVNYNILNEGSRKVVSRHHEVQYDNPTWCLRGTVFCSTANIKDLMGYWRFYEGFPKCLVGRTTSPIVKCYGFGDCSSDIAALAIHGRILACGSTKSVVYFYYLSDAYFDGSNSEIAEEFLRDPDYIAVASILIYDLRLCWIDNDLLLIVWSTTNDIEVIRISNSIT